jgi:hypothetical protein
MLRKSITRIVLTLALVALLIPASGCRRSRGSYTGVDIGFGFLPAFLGGGGFSESYFEESGYYDGGYYDDGYFEDYYESGYDDWDYGGFYEDDWKSKIPGRVKR